eukprot:TRINITY_DN9524_c1_g1_i1.p1 TRINITY_DN9524_c1_g1~~TRINITY_DN9524_c1_g1_i1.p1  ORF type:complete len:110 (+),score=0.82 TRINITY_DN9524_c1_g1_i1:185-514(+)
MVMERLRNETGQRFRFYRRRSSHNQPQRRHKALRLSQNSVILDTILTFNIVKSYYILDILDITKPQVKSIIDRVYGKQNISGVGIPAFCRNWMQNSLEELGVRMLISVA